jgi:hypothetical protein
MFTISGDQISEIILSYFNNRLDNLTYNLFYHPYWFIEIHMGLERKHGLLDATNSEVKIDVPELMCSRKLVPVAFDSLVLEVKDGYKPNHLRYAKVNEPEEAKSILEYKLKYLFPDKQTYIGVPHLINIPIWEFKVKDKKLVVYGNDENYKKNVLIWLEKTFPKKGKSQSQLFAETVKEFKSPWHFLTDFFKVVKNTNKWLLLFILILIILFIYVIITKIVAKAGQ